MCRRSWSRILGSPLLSVLRSKSWPDRFGIDGLAVFVREDRIVDPDGLPVATLPAAPSGEDLFGVGVEIDRASACSGFGWDFHGAALDALSATRNRESVRVDTPGAPSQPGDLPATHPSRRSEMNRRVEPEVRGVSEERCELLRGPDLWAGP